MYLVKAYAFSSLRIRHPDDDELGHHNPGLAVEDPVSIQTAAVVLVVVLHETSPGAEEDPEANLHAVADHHKGLVAEDLDSTLLLAAADCPNCQAWAGLSILRQKLGVGAGPIHCCMDRAW